MAELSRKPGKSHYICDLKRVGDKQTLCRLMDQPCYQCGICREVANRAENLCDRNPERLCRGCVPE